MSDRRLVLLAVAVALIAVGLLALQFPVHLNEFDHWGVQIACGNGFSAAPLQAAIADTAASPTQTSTHFSNSCSTALIVRRSWAIGVATLGAALLSWIAFHWLKSDEQSTH